MLSFFKKAIEYIKNWLFKSKKEEPKKPNINSLEYYLPTLNKETSLELFKKIRVGDIIYGPTSYKPKTLEKLEVSHRQRPYIVLKKEATYIIGFCGTSDLRARYRYSFNLYKENYNVSKDGIIDLSSTHNVNSVSILSIVDHLSSTDMFKINQIIYSSDIENKIMFEMGFDMRPGMIISESYQSKVFFLVYKIDGVNATLYRLIEKRDNVSLTFNGKKYYINIKEPIVVDKDLKCIVLKINEYNTVKTIKYKLNQNKGSTSTNSKNRYKESHYFRYDIGQVFIVGMRTFVYLFSSNNEDYAIEIYEDESISPITCISKYTDYMKADGMLEKDEILDVVSETAQRNKRCKWLFKFVKQQYGIIDDAINETESTELIEQKD